MWEEINFSVTQTICTFVFSVSDKFKNVILSTQEKTGASNGDLSLHQVEVLSPHT